ncbi:hypothetical protein [Armatimonas sp.]|uniref:hypothetical protein n=1 Tax=Armatimonas sp. TaxID=1872638 RepID=UPI00286A6D31|nr:hypothetical protein [Armatimonas sp.]
MKKWRYLTVVAKATQETGEFVYVYSINGDTSAPIIKKRTNLLGSDQRVQLSDYLDSAGEEGWEVCGMSPIAGGGQFMYPVSTMILLKQPTTHE